MQTPRDPNPNPSLQTSDSPPNTTHINSDLSAVHLSNRPPSSAISQNTKWSRTPWSAPRRTWRSCGGRARESTPPSTSSERTRWDTGANSRTFPVEKPCTRGGPPDKSCSLLLMKAVSDASAPPGVLYFFTRSLVQLKAEECYDWGVFTSNMLICMTAHTYAGA